MQYILNSQHLNHIQHSIFQQIISQYSLIIQKNIKALIKYYNHFKKVLGNRIIDNYDQQSIKNLLQISLIFTEKSNFYQTIQGKKSTGKCFSINDILKSKGEQRLKKLVILFREVLQQVKFKDYLLKVDAWKLMEKIQNFIQEKVLFQKLCMIFYGNTLQNSFEFEIYKTKLIDFGWYLYIDAKHTLIEQDYDFIVNKFLMISIMEMVVLNSLDYIHPLVLEKSSPRRYSLGRQNHKKELMQRILQILLKQANIQGQAILAYKNFRQAFDRYFDVLIQKQIIKSFSEQKFDYLCPKSLQINLSKLDRKINKQIKQDQIDLRKLLNFNNEGKEQEKSHKKTLIEEKLIVNRKKNIPNNRIKSFNRQENRTKKVFKSHRVLNLDQCEINNTTADSNSLQSNVQQSCLEQKQPQLPVHFTRLNKQKIRQSISQMNIPYLHRTSQNDELSSFISQKTRLYISLKSQNFGYESAFQLIENIYKKVNQILSRQNNQTQSLMTYTQIEKTTIKQIYQFYQFLCKEAWGNPEKQQNNNDYKDRYYILEQTDSTHECMIIFSFMTIIVSKYPKLRIQYLAEILYSQQQISYINLYYVLLHTQQVLILPKILQKLIKNLMSILISEYLWTDSDFIEQIEYISQFYDNSQQNLRNSYLQRQSISCVLENIAEHVKNQVDTFINQFIRPYYDNQQILNKVNQWRNKTIMYCFIILIYMPNSMYKHNLDQLIICTLYGVSRIIKFDVRFQHLINIYKHMTRNNQQLLQKTIFNIRNNKSFLSPYSEDSVKVNQNSQPNFKDILEFYNKQFIQYLKLSAIYCENSYFLEWIEQLTNYKVQFDFVQDAEIQIQHKDVQANPFYFRSQPIILSPRMRNKKKSYRSPIEQFYLNTENTSHKDNLEQRVELNFQEFCSDIEDQGQFELNDQGQLGIFSSVHDLKQSNKINIVSQKQNYMANQHNNTKQDRKFMNKISSRDPTRIKQRRTLEQMSQEYGYTKKAKHPIFTELRDQ